MRAFFLLLTATLLLGAPFAPALDKDDIKALLAKPHSRENLLPELRLFADARELEVEVVIRMPGEDPVVSDPIRVKEKVVEGKYVVSTFNPPGGPGEMVMVVTFDSKDGLYRKWVLLPDGNVGESIGISAKGSRAIAWTNSVDHGLRILSLEQHREDGVTWTERHEIDGKLVMLQTGIARKVKPAK